VQIRSPGSRQKERLSILSEIFFRPCNGIKEKAVGLKHIMSAHGVHFTKHGYEKLAETVVKCCKTQFEKSVSAASIVSARRVGTRQKTFYWRGFVSPVGSSRPASRTAAYLAAHPSGGGKWRNKIVGKHADKKQGGRNPPRYYRRNYCSKISV
jgi:hypothetical protein